MKWSHGMNKKLKTKDYISLALYAALYIALYFISMAICSLFGSMVHSFSTAVQGLIAGPLIYFVAHKIGKMWQFTIFSAIYMAIFTLMGSGYLPWVITTMTGAVIADLLVSKTNNPSTLKLGFANGIMVMGCQWGQTIPVWFFLDKFKEEWIARGVSPADMELMVAGSQGMMGILASVACIVGGIAGIYLGHAILKKHLRH